MKQKKTLKIWQFIILIVLLLAMLSTMFMPAFQLNGKVLQKIAMELKELGIAEIDDTIKEVINEFETNPNIVAEYDAVLVEVETESGIKIRSLSPFYFMTHSMTSWICGNKSTSEMYATVEPFIKLVDNGYNAFRVLLIVTYSVSIALIIWLFIAFFVKSSKKIPLIIGSIYGLYFTILFGIWRFASLKISMNKTVNMVVKSNVSMKASIHIIVGQPNGGWNAKSRWKKEKD